MDIIFGRENCFEVALTEMRARRLFLVVLTDIVVDQLRHRFRREWVYPLMRLLVNLGMPPLQGLLPQNSVKRRRCDHYCRIPINHVKICSGFAGRPGSI